MPFKSEKQRRFLWAEHPEIAKRWAHEYPESNKGLPMYANKKDTKVEKKAALEVLAGVINKSRSIVNSDNAAFLGQNTKVALDNLIRVELPQAEGPTYAGQEREQGSATESKNPLEAVNAENEDQACATDMLRKLSVVLSKSLREEMELEQALSELREPRFVPENLGVRRYSIPSPGVIHPAALQLAMQQQQETEEQKKKRQKDGPVGGGSNPQFNPINAFGAISSSGQLNGNAAFGQKNSPDSSKTAGVIKRANEPIDFDQWHGKAFKIVTTPSGMSVKSHTDGTPIADEPGRVSIVTPENGASWNWPAAPQSTINNFRQNWGSIQGGIGGYKMDQIRRAMGASGGNSPTQPPVAPPTPTLDKSAAKNSPDSSKTAGESSNLQWLTSIDFSGLPDPADLDLDDDERSKQASDDAGAAAGLNVRDWPAWQRALLGAGAGAGYGLRAGALAGGALGGLHGALTEPGEYVDEKGQKQKHTRLQHVLRSLFTGVGMGGAAGAGLGTVAGGAAPYLPEKLGAASTPCSCGCGDTVTTCKCGPDCKCRQPGGSCYKSEKAAQLGLWDRINAKRKRGEKPAKPGDKDYPDAKSWNKVTAISEKQSGSTPAWQRSEGKNEEGGLNEKGRKSYERETGGDLKAPVTESNPTGERAKRRSSFCARMCGMKRVNTGGDTARDPDSRINKSLRKWNCKCSSAAQFGVKLAQTPGFNFGTQIYRDALNQAKRGLTVSNAVAPPVAGFVGNRLGGPLVGGLANMGTRGVMLKGLYDVNSQLNRLQGRGTR